MVIEDSFSKMKIIVHDFLKDITEGKERTTEDFCILISLAETALSDLDIHKLIPVILNRANELKKEYFE